MFVGVLLLLLLSQLFLVFAMAINVFVTVIVVHRAVVVVVVQAIGYVVASKRTGIADLVRLGVRLMMLLLLLLSCGQC